MKHNTIIAGMKLKSNEINDIEAFLKTLNGELPKVSFPQLPVRASETPMPDLR